MTSPGRLFALALAALLAGAGAGSAADPQIEWVGDWDRALALAKESGRPVMVCINSKDGERASDATARDIYRDAEFVALSRRFVMVVVSTLAHRESGPCPRFGVVSCAEHLQCWKSIAAAHGDRLATAFAQGEMVTPQHVWLAPDGTIFRRKEYWTDKAELLERMGRVLEDLAAGAEGKGAGEGEAAEPPPGVPEADAPLTESERGDLGRAEGPDGEARRAALGNLLATEKKAARQAVVELLARATDVAVACDAIRALGRALVVDARPAIEERLEHKDPLVRSFAAVALEHLARPESVAPLLKRVRAERDPMARKNACRALGACAGPSGDKEAAAALLRTIQADKQAMVRKHAALALRPYAGASAAVVRGKLEQLALKTKDRTVRGGIVFTLAYVGDRESTEPVLRKVLDEMNDEWSKAFVREALRVLRGESSEFGRAAWFLYAEDRDDPARTEGAGD